MLIRTLMLSAAILCVATPPAAVAEPAQPSSLNRMVVQLPEIDYAMLAERVRATRSALVARKQALTRVVAEREPGGDDALVAAIMPGGLLYAGYRKVRYEQARKALAQVGEEIEACSRDLVAIETVPASLHLARSQ